MTRAVQIAACAVIAAIAAWALHLLHDVWECNIRAKAAKAEIVRDFDARDTTAARISAREVRNTMNRCIACSPTDVDQYMIRAAALRILDQPDEACADYRRALKIDRRPELFLNLGMTELESAHVDAAEDALGTAVYLFYSYIEDLPEPTQSNVRAAVTPTYVLIQERKAPPSAAVELERRIARDPR